MKTGTHTWENTADYVKGSPRPDVQAHLVYNAEQRIVNDNGKWTEAEAQGVVDDITSTRWWRNRTPRHIHNLTVIGHPQDIYDRKGMDVASASYWEKRLYLPKWAREPITIVHEMSHLIHHSKSNKQAWHGPEYAYIMKEMSERFHSPYLHRRLMIGFEEYEVQVKKIRVLKRWI